VVCSNCGENNAPDRKFCGECGAPLARVCARCGSTNAVTAKFCGECGASITAPETAPGTSVASPSQVVAEIRLVSVLFATPRRFASSSHGISTSAAA
jgi:uncharacterized membrane protein YvbJ